jgi:hypothetical protein
MSWLIRQTRITYYLKIREQFTRDYTFESYHYITGTQLNWLSFRKTEIYMRPWFQKCISGSRIEHMPLHNVSRDCSFSLTKILLEQSRQEHPTSKRRHHGDHTRYRKHCHPTDSMSRSTSSCNSCINGHGKFTNHSANCRYLNIIFYHQWRYYRSYNTASQKNSCSKDDGFD